METAASTAQSAESDSSGSGSTAKSDEQQAPSSGITNPRAQVSRIINYVTQSIRRRRWEAKQSRHSADDLLRYLSAGEDIVNRYSVASVMNYTVLASLYTLRSVVYLQCNEKEQALEYADRAVSAMLQEKVPYVSYMTMTVFSRVLQVLIPFGAPEKVEKVMQLLSATSVVWPVTGIYLVRARKRIAQTMAMRAGGSGPGLSAASGSKGTSKASTKSPSELKEAPAVASSSSASSAAAASGANDSPESRAQTSGASSGRSGQQLVRKSRYGVDGDLPVVAAVSSTHALGSDPLEATGLLLPSTARIMMVGNSDGVQAEPDSAHGLPPHLSGFSRGSTAPLGGSGVGLPRNASHSEILQMDRSQSASSAQSLSGNFTPAEMGSSAAGGSTGLIALQ